MRPELAVCFKSAAGTGEELSSVPSDETSSEINKLGIGSTGKREEATAAM